MLIFSGDLSQNVKSNVVKKQKILTSLVALTISCIFSIPFIVLTIQYNWIFIIAILTIFTLPIFQYFSFKGSVLDLILPNKVIIDNQFIVSLGKNFRHERKIQYVKKIVDYGDWYQIFFKYPYKNQTYICQKDLIKEGTIEDFENLFKGKIVRKIKK